MGTVCSLRGASQVVSETVWNFEGAGTAMQLVRLRGMSRNIRISNGFSGPAMVAPSAAGRAPRSARRREPAPGTSMTWRLREPRPRRDFIQKVFVFPRIIYPRRG